MGLLIVEDVKMSINDIVSEAILETLAVQINMAKRDADEGTCEYCKGYLAGLLRAIQEVEHLLGEI